jgi:hypothetical protein
MSANNRYRSPAVGVACVASITGIAHRTPAECCVGPAGSDDVPAEIARQDGVGLAVDDDLPPPDVSVTIGPSTM